MLKLFLQVLSVPYSDNEIFLYVQVFVCSQGNTQDREHIFKFGMWDVLCKDFSLFFAFLTVPITTMLDISTARIY